MAESTAIVPTANSFNVASLWGETKDLIKFGVAAKYAPQSLSNQQNTPATPTAAQGHTIADALAPLAAVYAADQAVKRTNKNPPYVIYTLLGFVVVGTGLYLYRPVRK
jgi:hypothetical protein